MPLAMVVGLGPGVIELDGDGRRREGVCQIFLQPVGALIVKPVVQPV